MLGHPVAPSEWSRLDVYSDSRRRKEKMPEPRIRHLLTYRAKSFGCNNRHFSHRLKQKAGTVVAKNSSRAGMAPGGFVKKIFSRMSLATLTIAIGMISWGNPLHAQTTPSAPTDQQAPQATPNSQPETQQPPSPEMPPQSQQAPSAQTPDQSSPDTSAPTSGSKSAAPSDSTAASDSQTFSGTVVKQGDKYMLKDDAGKTYDIDHQTDVAKFDGKRVRVQGTLDPTGKKIMVK